MESVVAGKALTSCLVVASLSRYPYLGSPNIHEDLCESSTLQCKKKKKVDMGVFLTWTIPFVWTRGRVPGLLSLRVHLRLSCVSIGVVLSCGQREGRAKSSVKLRVKRKMSTTRFNTQTPY